MEPDPTKALADYVSLLYHEARNVRHLIGDGHLSSKGWERIISLPKNRNKAWKAIQSTRQKGHRTSSPDELLLIFRNRFGVGLEDLKEMFENPNWKHARLYGGNAWARIVKDVIQFAQAVKIDDEERQQDLLNKLKEARHNTGELQSKLEELDSSLSSGLC